MPLNFIERAQKRTELYNRFIRETNLTRFEEGSKSRSLIDSVLTYQEAIEELMAEEINRANPLVAGSTFQEYWADFLNVRNVPASKVVVRASQQVVKLYVEGGTFGDLDGGSTITIPPGEMLITGRSRTYNNGEINEQDLTYKNPELITLQPGDSEAWISIEASGFGEIYRLEKGQLINHNYEDYSSFPNFTLKITNILPITSGYDGDTADILSTKMYRASLFSRFDIEDKISNLLIEIPEIEDYLILPRFSGPGTTDIFVDNSFFTIDDTVLEQVRDRLESIQNNGTQIFVSKVPRVGVTIILTLDFIPSTPLDDRLTILDQVRNLIYGFLSRLGIGESFDFLSAANQIKANFPMIRSFGRSNQYFDEVKVYRQGIISDRVGSYFDQDNLLTVRPYERIFPETTFPNPILVRVKNA